jgi:hypothetical protein
MTTVSQFRPFVKKKVRKSWTWDQFPFSLGRELPVVVAVDLAATEKSVVAASVAGL